WSSDVCSSDLTVDRLTGHVQDAAQRAFTHGNGDRLARVQYPGAAHESVRGIHRDGTHLVVTQMKGHFQNQVVFLTAFDEGVRRGQRRVERGQFRTLEAHVDDGTHDGGDRTEVFVRHFDSP